MKSYLRKQEKSQIATNSYEQKKEATKDREQTKPKISRKKEILRIKTEINEIETKKIIFLKIR